MKCCITICRQRRLQIGKIIRRYSHVSSIFRRKNVFVRRINAFFMLDTIVGVGVMFLVLSMFTSIFFMFSQMHFKQKHEICDSFYLAMKLNQLGEHTIWKFDNEKRITTDEVVIDVDEIGRLIKRSHHSGYEYMGTCPNVSFQKEGDDIQMVFHKTNEKEEEVYRLIQKKE